MNKIGWLVVIWVLTIGAYLLMVAAWPAYLEIIAVSSAEMQATANMSRLPGTLEAVESAPIWLWFIPGGVSIVTTVIMLKSK